MLSFYLIVTLTTFCFALTTVENTPTVHLDKAKFLGTNDHGVVRFLGIPYALPPVGGLRFEPPVQNHPYTGTKNATAFGRACIQTTSSGNSTITPASQGEDCLTINVFKPLGITTHSKLPVVVLFHGGGFYIGGSEFSDGGSIVLRSVALGSSVIYVSMNYRLNGFGFLPGREVKASGSGNLGLQDQRLALKWVQKYIGAFGGDPSKVTIWGQSAGAASVASQMLAYDGTGDKLFRAAFMQSGSPIPMGDIKNGQHIYDNIVANVGCTGAADTLKCLKLVPSETLAKAFSAIPDIGSYSSLNRAWAPRADGVFLRDAAQKLVLRGKVAKIPFVTGDCDDEGTIFSTGSLNVTITEQLRGYLHDVYFPLSSSDEIGEILDAYPDDVAQGSPFDTSTANVLSPQYKRIAAFTGDFGYQATRRFFLDQLADKQNTWAYLSKRNKTTPYLGSYHGTDVLFTYNSSEIADGLIRLVTELTPGPSWPKYDTRAREILTFYDESPSNVTRDTYRQKGTDVLTKLSLKYPL